MHLADDVRAVSSLIPGDGVDADAIDVDAGTGSAASAFAVDRLLAASASYAAASLDALGATNRGPDRRRLDLDHVRSFCTTHLEVDGEPVPGWAPLSGVYETADRRHLQIHCNFPHHEDAVVDTLGTARERDAVAAAIRERDAITLETELIEAGGIAAAVRTLDEWEGDPHAEATRALPTIGVERIGDAAPTPPDHPTGRPLRVLDTSRVLAGPVAGQLLATGGADVLRVGAAHLPSVDVGVISTGFGKRNAFVDLRTDTGRATMTELIAGADVWIDAYRPGAFAASGFTPEHAAALHPGLVMVQVSAFDWVGPMAGRRGFDSIVQSTTGLRWAGGRTALGPDGEPAPTVPLGLPVQALDYASGFLAAGAAAQLVGHQRSTGGSWLARLSLLRTRDWLVSMGGPAPYEPRALVARPNHLATVETEFGSVTSVTPFLGSWPSPPRRLGTSPPAWC